MSRSKWTGTSRLVLATASALSMLLSAGCSGSLSSRYSTMRSDLRESNRTAKRSPEDEDIASADADVLTRQRLIADVLARNPGIEAARQGWRAALARYPQTDALDDPRLSYGLAPGTIVSDSASFGQTITISQRLPWPGKLALSGEVAMAEAEARQHDVEAVRQRLAFMASMLFDDYYVTFRALEVNAEHAQLLKLLQTGAEAQYVAGRGSQQDPLQAEVELAHLEHEQVVLETRRRLVVAQVNGLLHRSPGAPLPPPPAELQPAHSDVHGSQTDQPASTLKDRPEVRAAGMRLTAAESAIELAERRYYPDLTLSGTYNSMWAATSHQFMVGASINIPIQLGSRDGAAAEARARLAQSRSELELLTDEVSVEVEQARLRVAEAGHVAELYKQRLLPVARSQIDAATSAFEAGQSSFLSLIDAERNLRRVKVQYHEAVADTHRRAAALRRALGQPPLATPDGASP